MLIDSGLILIGLILLYYGGDFLVTGSTRLAKRFKISPFIIGATVIGFGTSAPELAVSILASIHGSGELALGNVIGSNIANVGLVLGLTAMLVPLTIDGRRLNEEAPSLIIASLLITALAWDNNLSRIEGGIMLVLLLAYLWRALSKNDSSDVELEEDGQFLENKGPAVQSALVLVGLVMLVFGAEWMVDGATGIAREMGISEWFIGVSIVAVGTSLPEIVSSIIAARRGHGEMAIGNVFGSNIFNILLVMGAASSIQPLTIKVNIHPDLIYTTALTCLLILLIRLGHIISKRDGFLLVACYGVYIGLKGIGVL
ncbi:MAG: calcium/sodium antiporter [Nitrospinaceae bacterium]|jgi:cation:H+ antiporter|nr:calcium/sodium antiporter [Nitrospinaceae bacterium]|tara:strand:+ start:1866 stop:2807 length:942 start_codon:yes stop_codon:yes gene_type:complete